MKFLHTRIRVGDLDRSPLGNDIAHLELPGNTHLLELTGSAVGFS